MNIQKSDIPVHVKDDILDGQYKVAVVNNLKLSIIFLM